MAPPESWYVIWTDNPAVSQRLQVQSYEIVQTQKPPSAGSTFEGLTVTSVQGPYKTKAEAQSAIGATSTSGVGEGAGSGVASANVPNPFSWLGVIGHWIGDLVEHLTDAAMWKSIGWLALGILLIITGILLWVKQNTGSLPAPFPVPV